MPSTSSRSLIDKQQATSSILKDPTIPATPENLIDQRLASGSASAIENGLRRQISGLEDRVRLLKLNDPVCEAAKHALLQEELHQLREQNLNLRIDLRVAQGKYNELESEHRKCKVQMEKAMEEAIRNLAAGLDLSKGESTNLGLSAKAVSPGERPLPPQQSVTNPTAQKASGASSAIPLGVTGSSVGCLSVQADSSGQHPLPCSAAQGFRSAPSTLQSDQPDAPKPPSLDFSSNSTGSAFHHLGRPSPTTGPNAADFQGPSKLNSALFVFGDPHQTIQVQGCESYIFINTPGYCGFQEQSFEEARLRRYELCNIKRLPPQTSGKTPFIGALSSGGFFQRRKTEKPRDEFTCREERTPSSVDTAGASDGPVSKSA